LIAWAFFDGVSTYYIDFKTNLYSNFVSHGYAYKTLPDDASTVITGDAISVFPNPAMDHITISNSGKIAQSYRISNVLGQEVGAGMLTEVKTGVSLYELPAGSYIVTLYQQEKICGRQLFVKK
jgi:hypothetical protein